MSEKELDKRQSNEKYPFKVPEGYFNKKKKLLYAIANEETSKTIAPFWKQTYVWSTGIAALLAIALFFYFQESPPPVIVDRDLPSNTEVTLNNLSTDEIEEYLLDAYQYNTDDDLMHSELEVLDFEGEELNL
jgi:hypothetical protein